LLALWPQSAEPAAGKRLGPDLASPIERPRQSAEKTVTIGLAAPLDALDGICGDSILDPGEECDDGNTAAGDGCSDICLIEDGWTCTEPVPPQPGTNLIADPGFEAGTPNPAWTEFSTNFGSPLCTLGTCGDEGSGPNTGIWWAWFGGTTVFEEGSLTQELVIPTTATTLELELEQIFCDSADDFLEVTIDGSRVFVTNGASPLCSVLGYSTQSLDVSSFADGAVHTLELHSQTFGTNGDITDFFVDDLVLLDNVPTPQLPSDCFLLLPLECNGPLFDFDSPVSGIPRDWTVVDNAGTGVVWSDIAGAGEIGNYTGGSGEAATGSSDAFGEAEYDTELRTAPFDLPALAPGSVALLSYVANYQDFLTGALSDFLDLDISTNGGTTWTNLLSWDDDHGELFEPPGEAASVDLTSYLGVNGLILRWRYYDAGTGDFDWYAQIDDVGLACGAPDIAVSPSSLSLTQQPDTQVLENLTVASTGITPLIWEIVEAASSCTAPSDVPWLSAAPTGGTTAAGSETAVDVTLDSTGLAPATYNAKLCINSNDPVNPTVEVPVTMEVVGCVDHLVLSGTVLTGGSFTAGISITGGPDLLIDGPVGFTAQEIRFLSGVEIRNGFSAALAASPCP
jgi:cysteine-rich repeat protein